MKIHINVLDRLILTLLGYVVLIDMINGFFAMEFTKLPISQIFKFILLLLFLLRLSKTKDFLFLIGLLIIFQIGPLIGIIKTGDFSSFSKDIIVATKWFNVPLSFFYFKNLFQHRDFGKNQKKLFQMVNYAFVFIVINMVLGFVGLGMAFYHHGFDNAVGTRGYIFAGNELTILVLALAFIIGSYQYHNKKYKQFVLSLLVFLAISFLITSKTVLGGTIIVFLIPVISHIGFPIKRKWIERLTLITAFGIPILSLFFYFGIISSGVIEKIKFSMKRNDYDILTVALSNRNNFVRQGWEVYAQEYSIWGKLFGFGQEYHLQLSGHSAEIDFFSLLFASGILGLMTLFLLLLYWILNAYNLSSLRENGYARSVFFFVLFLTVVANLSGHIFGSGIAGIFIGLAISLMFYKTA